MSYMRNVKAATFVSTGYNPATDVPNLLSWYRADTTTNSGGFVDSLNDKKGAVNYTQTLTKRPALISAGSDPNGRACIVFDGVDDYLLQATGHGAMNDCTIFGVVRSVVASSVSGRIWCITNLAAKSITVFTNALATDPTAGYYNPNNTASSRPVELSGTGTTIYSASAPRILTVRHDSTAANTATPTTRSRLGTPKTANNVSNATISTIAAGAACFGAIPGGTAAYLSYGLYEWMICNALLTDDQCRTVECYLAGYYGLL